MNINFYQINYLIGTIIIVSLAAVAGSTIADVSIKPTHNKQTESISTASLLSDPIKFKTFFKTKGKLSAQYSNKQYHSIESKQGSPKTPKNPFNFVLGGLFPSDIILSSSLKQQGNTVISSNGPRQLEADLRITSDPVDIPGINNFIQNWLFPQLNTVNTDPKGTKTPWVQMYLTVKNQWTGTPRNNSITDLVEIGYMGPGADQLATNDAFWNANGTASDELFKDIQNEENYNVEALWGLYDPANILLYSDFDEDALRQNLINLLDPQSVPNPDLWYPSILYTFQHANIKNRGNLTAPVLIIQPGDDIILNFSNDIKIGTLSQEELQLSTLIANNTYGNSASAGLAGSTSANFHLHGSHTNPTAFGDNVVARYTSGQSWTTHIEIPIDHGNGSYWYHSHYHPAVNQQVYGGLSGFMQIGDPLAKIPALKDTPRNLAILKLSQISSANGGEEILLSGYDNIGVGVNRLTMVTVNGQFQPVADAGKGGWQSLSLSNQTNNAQYQVLLIHTDKQGNRKTLELFQYGEDGHQFPQIFEVKGVLGQNSQNFGSGESAPPTAYKQTKDVLVLAPGKRVDVLFYLPEGTTELASIYSFTDPLTKQEFFVRNAGRYPELSNANTTATGGNTSMNPAGLTGFGALASFEVDQPVKDLSTFEQYQEIQDINATIKIQDILPSTPATAYDPNAVPRIDLFATTNGQPVWTPIRSRSFSFSRTLVGPESEWDSATQAQIKNYEEQNPGNDFKRYQVLPIALNGEQFSNFPSWLGYAGPWLINDHVFPQGNLTIAQLGTIEEWDLKNWSVSRINALKSTITPSQYVGHPFHIHINDFQVKNSDTELNGTGSLQDVTMLNSSGYYFYNTALKRRDTLPPFAGKFESIPEALDPSLVAGLGTWGANTQTIRMVFQDYVGTYVFHCHILPHEDAGMMQVITVIENTDSSWLAPSEGFKVTTSNSKYAKVQQFNVFQAQNLQAYEVAIKTNSQAIQLKRLDVGNINSGFTQDLLVSSSGDGLVRVIDGESLQKSKKAKSYGKYISNILAKIHPYFDKAIAKIHRYKTISLPLSKVIAKIHPYQSSSLAPYAFAEDFTGDNLRDIVTAGFANGTEKNEIDLADFTITGWLGSNEGEKWTRSSFNSTPYKSDNNGVLPISGEVLHNGTLKTNNSDNSLASPENLADGYQIPHDLAPVAGLKPAQFSITIGDFNLDNFNDYAMAYATDSGLRITILDGAAAALLFSTGQNEGGFFPNESVLADALVFDSSLEGLSSISLNSGFNSFYQSAIENLIATIVTKTGEIQQLTLQLDAGHFIATSEPDNPEGLSFTSLHQGHSRMSSYLHDDKVINLINPSSTPLHLSDIALIPSSTKTSTPGFASVFGNGVLIIDQYLLLAQGSATNGKVSTSPDLFNTAQQLVINLDELNIVDYEDVTGYDYLSFEAEDIQQRNNMANFTYAAYFGRLPNPGGTAVAAASLSSVITLQDYVNKFLTNPGAESQIIAHFGSTLENTDVATIVNVTYKTLYASRANSQNINYWQNQISANVLSKTFLPLAILQSTRGKDLFRLEFISSAAQFSNVQWGNDAVLLGSFGQGFVEQDTRFIQLNEQIFGSQASRLRNRKKAQKAFDRFSRFTVELLVGSKVSKSGFF